MKRVLVLPALLTAVAFAQNPAITAVQDGGGYTNDIPQGAVLVVKGTNLSAAGIQQAQAPAYPATLNNVRITFTAVSGGAVVNVLMVYTYNQSGVNQLAGVLPSTAATGAYDVRVINGSATSAPFRANVVARKVGIVTADGSGSGEAQATLSGALILQRKSNQGKIGQFDTRPARPGERMDLWGTGIGADVASDTGGTSGDQTAAASIRVIVDGTEIVPLYAGRSQGFPGLDQIVFNIPASVTPSCTNSVQVRAGGVLSNLVTIATSNSDTCPPPQGGGGGGGSNTNPTQQEIDTWISRGFYTVGNMTLTRSTSYTITDSFLPGGTATTTITKADAIGGQFNRVSGTDLAKMLRGELPPGFPNLQPAVGSCVVYTTTNLTNPYPNVTFRGLDAGPQLTSVGPNGQQPVPRLSNQTTGFTYNTPNSFPNTYLAAGNYTLSGPGGADVGAFSGSLTVAGDLVVTNPDDLKVVNRANGATVRWTGGEPSTVLTISGTSITVNSSGQVGAGAGFVCIQNTSAGQFTVPASILTQLPASPTLSAGAISIITRGSFGVTAGGKGNRFNAPAGLDILTANNFWSWIFSTEYR
jgi:uncharacterized protein (TIGR03437 family)